jgi:hypothetical protein
VKETYRRRIPHADLIDFDERDLLRWTEQAGFVELRLDYQVLISEEAPPAQ